VSCNAVQQRCRLCFLRIRPLGSGLLVRPEYCTYVHLSGHIAEKKLNCCILTHF